MDNQLKLPDGRLLGYAEYGDPLGKPILYFHGWPGSRLEARIAEQVAHQRQVRLIAVDRPGMGLSSFQPRRTLLDWPEDINRLADSLSLDRFAIVGVSGGGPYVIACASKIPGRLTKVGIVCGVRPVKRPAQTSTEQMLLFCQQVPWLMRLLLNREARRIRRDPAQALAQTVDQLPPADQAVFAQDQVRQTMMEDLIEAFQQGARGIVADGALYARDWGIDFDQIRAPVFIWQGEQDTTVLPRTAQLLARLIPTARVTFFAEEGHYSLPINRMGEIVEVLV
jgi:pimeloyl-ACP methyl ester carboxylesterase